MSEIDDRDILRGKLSKPERTAVAGLLRCLRTPCEEWVNPASTLVTSEFAAEFRSRLLTQHVFVGTPLLDLTFERAFVAAMQAAGIEVREASGATGRFWDFRFERERFSLKSSKAKSLSRSKAAISKLTEAAWIQDCRTASTRRAKTRELFEQYLDHVDRLIQIRYFEAGARYELIEIPLELFRSVLHVPLTAFRAEGPSIGIPVGQNPPDFTLVLDRSDAKVTVRNILLSKCIVHASWTVAAGMRQ